MLITNNKLYHDDKNSSYWLDFFKPAISKTSYKCDKKIF